MNANLIIEFDNRIGADFTTALEEIIRLAVGTTLDHENFWDCHESVEVSVSIVTDEEIRELNKKYRSLDRATDVLSFPLEEWDEAKGDDEPLALGDIVISWERARTQAAEYGHSMEREMGFLTAHSMLHLLGYDHESPMEEAEMFGKQEEILSKAGLFR